MLENSRNEMIRQLIAFAVQTGKHLTSNQTGYIHYTYHNETGTHHSIPLYENWLFVLALFRTKIAENILDAKALIEKLLHFQSSNGNFPIYLHEYPSTFDDCQATYLLPIHYWIIKNFQNVLGAELKQKLEKSFTDLLNFSQKLDSEKKLPLHFQLRVAATIQAAGEYFHDDQLLEEGKDKVAKLIESLTPYEQFSTEKLGHLIVSLQLIYESIKESPFSHLWNYLQNTWDARSNAYCGPCYNEWQYGNYPKGSLYDLYLRFFSDSVLFPFENQLFYLSAAMIQLTDDSIEKNTLPFELQGDFKNTHWLMQKNSICSYNLITRTEPLKPEELSGFHSFKLIWGDHKLPHTFVSQENSSLLVNYYQTQEGVELDYLLSSVIQAEIKEKAREINFYFDAEGESKILVSDHISNTFLIDDTITVTKKGLQLSITFEVIEGEGQFQGHIMPGNRPSQKVKDLLKAYDKQIFLRTIRRSEKCRIKVHIKIN